ncbi:MAG: bifunctional hydroxymethylpyrimidine kinase/phosphomethylpyrimidine kinase [Myxococcaceae bacterium]|nr:bifunctional hydroxymethylpyrimidine kinase/phosphomethylpyrimidine kinase [Myxococcaceae bacterium]
MSRGGSRILVAAGLDPSGRAGLFADVETVRSLGAQPLAIPTALTAQGARTFAVTPVSPRMLGAQIDALLELGPIDAVKLGMVPDRAVLQAIVRAVPRGVPWIVDPVVRTSRGQPLSSLGRRDYLALAGPHVILTPNLNETAWLLGRSRPPADAAEAESCARALIAHGFGGVVVKGGHLRGVKVDVVVPASGPATLQKGRALKRPPTKRGSGCRYASALAVGVARREALAVAARRAKRVVEKFLRAPILGQK